MATKTKTDPAPSVPAEPYQPTEAEFSAVKRFTERRKAQLRPPKVKVKNIGPKKVDIAADHPDRTVWSVQMAETFGVTEAVLADRLFNQVLNATHAGGNQPVQQEVVNAALAAVHGIAPRDTTEGLLAAQMVATHHAAMELLRRTNGADTIQRLEANGNMATKMLRTFAAQMEALKRYRSKGEQRVVVQHQHVNVTAEQAAVQVNAGAPPLTGGTGGTLKLEEQPHAHALAHAHLAPMLCPDPARDALPMPSGAGAESLPDARRG